MEVCDDSQSDEYRDALPLAFHEPPAFRQEFASFISPSLLRSNSSSAKDQHGPPFPCPHCDKLFHRRNEWTRHGSDVHQPELKLCCPHADCDRLFSRLYRLKQHYSLQHNGTITASVESRLRNTSIDKVWACGFCVNCSTTWNDLAKHIWSHFRAGSTKERWSTSTYIQSLLQHPSVRFDWLALLQGQTNAARLEWSESGSKELQPELEWIRPSRKPGPVLAAIAYDRLQPSRNYILPVPAAPSYTPGTSASDDVSVGADDFIFTGVTDISSMDHLDFSIVPALGMEWPYPSMNNTTFEESVLRESEWLDPMTLTDDAQGSLASVRGSMVEFD